MSAAPRHTPGPWKVERSRNWHSSEHGDGKTHPSVNGWRCPAAQYSMSPETEEANARLIAAAPEHYELLRGIADYLADWDHYTDAEHGEWARLVSLEISAAIAKAEGRAG